MPPYIERPPNRLDEARYQTVYAENEGSVAAPTAGLHFTAELLNTLRAGGVLVEGLDLQVGPGTFKPVEVEDPSKHEMHPEQYHISAELVATVERVRRDGRPHLGGWHHGGARTRERDLPQRRAAAGIADTRLLITPGYRFRQVDRLITNFHLPRSTLLMLVCAFAGRDLMMAAYHHAVAARYRFYSYGDAMVII